MATGGFERLRDVTTRERKDPRRGDGFGVWCVNPSLHSRTGEAHGTGKGERSATDAKAGEGSLNVGSAAAALNEAAVAHRSAAKRAGVNLYALSKIRLTAASNPPIRRRK